MARLWKRLILFSTIFGLQSLIGPAQPAAQSNSAFSAEKLEQAQQNVQRYVDDGQLAGVLTLVVHRGEVVHRRAYGVRDLETGVPMDFDTLFRLASMTKPITSVALMMLYEEGKVGLNDPVAMHIPAFAETPVYTEGGLVLQARPMTVRDALMHTTGVTSGSFGNGPIERLYREANLDEPATLEAFVNRLATLPLAHQPGAHWTYGYSTDLVARIVEVVSGEPFDVFITERIFRPLQMNDTGFELPESKMARLATAYTAGGGSLRQLMPNRPRTVAYPHGVGGLFSTLSDYLRFARMLLNGGALGDVRLLGPETVALMTHNHLPEALQPIGVMDFTMVNNGFGLGFSVVVDTKDAAPQPNGFWWNRGGRPPVGSYWWIGALQTYFWIDPANEIIGMLMTQSADLPLTFNQEFHTMVYDAFQPDTAP